MRAALLTLAIIVAALPAVADEASGPAVVLDRDTIRIGDTTIRLFGVDAPESAQTCSGAYGKSYKCGQAATERVEALTRGKTVSCSGSEKDRYGRLLARCTVGTVSINGTIVREGLAWAFIRYSSAFAAEEADARSRKVGVFAAQNEPPWSTVAGDGKRLEVRSDVEIMIDVPSHSRRRGSALVVVTMTAAEHVGVDWVAEPLKGQGTNVQRTIDRLSLLATSVVGLTLITSTAQAQRELPNYNDLPCNALCRAYMGSYYAPPEPEVSPEPVPEPEAAVAVVPPRPPSRQIVRPPRRAAAFPPVRPSDLRLEPAGSGEIEVVLPPPVPADPAISLEVHRALVDAQISATSVIDPDVRVVLPPEAEVPAFDLEPAPSAHRGAIEAAPTRPAEE